MRRTTAFSVLSLLAACRVALPPAVPAPRGHGLQRVWIESLGLEGLPCAVAVADGLRRLDGVASVDVDLQRNLCTITPDPTRRLALDGVPLAVRRAGYRAGRMWILAEGDLVQGTDGATFTMATGPTFTLVGEAPSTGSVHGVVEFAPPRLSIDVPLPR